MCRVRLVMAAQVDWLCAAHQDGWLLAPAREQRSRGALAACPSAEHILQRGLQLGEARVAVAAGVVRRWRRRRRRHDRSGPEGRHSTLCRLLCFGGLYVIMECGAFCFDDGYGGALVYSARSRLDCVQACIVVRTLTPVNLPTCLPACISPWVARWVQR
jgi:hypothetical protein